MTTGMQQHRAQNETIVKEVIFGLIAVALGTYSLASKFGYVPKYDFLDGVTAGVLIAVGLALWVTAFKLWKYRWHQRRLF
jgi:hypothetical protein